MSWETKQCTGVPPDSCQIFHCPGMVYIRRYGTIYRISFYIQILHAFILNYTSKTRRTRSTFWRTYNFQWSYSIFACIPQTNTVWLKKDFSWIVTVVQKTIDCSIVSIYHSIIPLSQAVSLLLHYVTDYLTQSYSTSDSVYAMLLNLHDLFSGYPSLDGMSWGDYGSMSHPQRGKDVFSKKNPEEEVILFLCIQHQPCHIMNVP